MFIYNLIFKLYHKGEFHFNNGEKYVGEVRNGLRQGKGSFYTANGDRYVDCDWIEDKQSGKGECLFSNGNKYVGDFVNGKPNGQGEYHFKNFHEIHAYSINMNIAKIFYIQLKGCKRKKEIIMVQFLY